MTSRGFYLVHRGWMSSPDFQREPFTEREAYLWSIEQAAFEAHSQWFNGVQYAVDRGEFVTSVRAMAAAFGWGPKKVRCFEKRMIKVGKWTQREAQLGTHGPTVLTICNYERFQAPAKARGTAEDTAEGTAGAQLGHSEGTQQKERINNGNELQAIGEANASPCARAQGTRLPDGWEPKPLNADTISAQIAATRGDAWVARALESFRNYWRSAIGPKARKRDWQATWANWIIEQDNRDGRRKDTNGMGRNQPADGLSPTSRAAVSVFGPPGTGL